MSDDAPKPNKGVSIGIGMGAIAVGLAAIIAVVYGGGRLFNLIGPPAASAPVYQTPPAQNPPVYAPQPRGGGAGQQPAPPQQRPASRTTEQVVGLNAQTCPVMYPGARWIMRQDGSGYCYRVVRQ